MLLCYVAQFLCFETPVPPLCKGSGEVGVKVAPSCGCVQLVRVSFPSRVRLKHCRVDSLGVISASRLSLWSFFPLFILKY